MTYPRSMIRTKILGLGSYVPDRVVTNEELPFLERSARAAGDAADRDQRRVDPAAHRDQGAPLRAERRHDRDQRPRAPGGPKRALADANLEPSDIDCIILGTLSPDIHFPGTGVFLQKKLGIDRQTSCACFDIRQQCSGVRLRPADGRRVHPHRHVQAHPAGRRRAPQPLARLHDARPRRDGAVRRRRGRDGPRPDGDRRSARRRDVHVRARRRHRRDGPLPQDLRDREAAVHQLRREGSRAERGDVPAHGRQARVPERGARHGDVDADRRSRRPG